MRGWKKLLFLGLTGMAVTLAGCGASDLEPSASVSQPNSSGQPQAGVWDLLAAIPFKVDQPYTHWWRKEQPSVRAGHLLVLAVDPEVVQPRQIAEPVLYAGDQTAERINSGFADGALVVLVPSTPNSDGWPARDLTNLPIWFGDPALPEQVDEAAIRQAQALVPNRLGFGSARVNAALDTGGEPLHCRDLAELYVHAADWVERFAPQDRHVVERLRMNR